MLLCDVTMTLIRQEKIGNIFFLNQHICFLKKMNINHFYPKMHTAVQISTKRHALKEKRTCFDSWFYSSIISSLVHLNKWVKSNLLNWMFFENFWLCWKHNTRPCAGVRNDNIHHLQFIENMSGKTVRLNILGWKHDVADFFFSIWFELSFYFKIVFFKRMMK